MEKLSDKCPAFQTGLLYSYLGYRCIQKGDVEVMKHLYGNICFESSPLIQTINRMQYCITADEIEDDEDGKYNNSFLYYWGMACTGELSSHIAKELSIAKACFKKTLRDIPKSEARIAYIELLKSDEPHKSESNANRLKILVKWAGKTDLFSMIALAKISHYAFLSECPNSDLMTRTETTRLLQQPYGKGHPVAIRFYDSILEDARKKNTESNSVYNHTSLIYDNRVNIDVLYDC